MDAEWLKYLVAILSGLATCIPLAVKLVEYVRKATKERNWNQLLSLVMELMETAETMFDDGASRKQWVMSMIEAASGKVNYDIDMAVVGELIDSLCDMSKIVNAPSADKTAA